MRVGLGLGWNVRREAAGQVSRLSLPFISSPVWVRFRMPGPEDVAAGETLLCAVPTPGGWWWSGTVAREGRPRVSLFANSELGLDLFRVTEGRSSADDLRSGTNKGTHKGSTGASPACPWYGGPHPESSVAGYCAGLGDMPLVVRSRYVECFRRTTVVRMRIEYKPWAGPWTRTVERPSKEQKTPTHI